MAAGDIIWFNAARSLSYFAGWAGADDIRIQLVDNTTTPAANTATPALGDFTAVTSQEGSQSLGTWASGWNDATAGGTGILDYATNPLWVQDAGNDTDARWGIIYNDTRAGDPAIAYVDLGAVVDLTAGQLGINWNAGGLATVTTS